MGCNCNKGKSQRKTGTEQDTSQGTTQSFALDRRDGSTERFGSRLEAEAARIRAGGGQVRPL